MEKIYNGRLMLHWISLPMQHNFFKVWYTYLSLIPMSYKKSAFKSVIDECNITANTVWKTG